MKRLASVQCSSSPPRGSRFHHLAERSICGQMRKFSSVVHNYDIVIAGGGMVGKAAACALATSSFLCDRKVLLLDAEPKKLSPRDAVYSNRVSALTPATKRFFHELGAWDEKIESRCKPIHQMRVWDALSGAAITFNPNEGSPSLAYVVENDIITEALERGLATRAQKNNVECLCATATSYLLPDDAHKQHFVEIRTNTNETIRTKLLIAADGVNSLARRSAKVPYVEWSYQRRAVVATLKVEENSDRNAVAWQRFLPNGPVALLPLTNSLSSLVWTVLPSEAQKLSEMSAEEFTAELNNALRSVQKHNSSVIAALSAFGIRLTSCDPLHQPPKVLAVESGSRASFPLGFGHAADYTAPRMVLIGDAAHRVHPLAGQGVNLGFGDVKELVSLLAEAANNGDELGLSEVLQEYQKRRLRNNLVIMGAVDGLHRLYALDWSPAVLFRSVGLQLIDSLPAVKEAIVARASG